jgi:uncharacterized phage protein (TIGR02216 family)
MGLSPRTFWAMSLPEWRAAICGFQNARGIRAAAPLARKDLEALMELYPDG